MEKKLFEKYEGGQDTASMLEAASRICENYGVWSEQAAQVAGKSTKAVSYEPIIYLMAPHAFMSRLPLTAILLVTPLPAAGLAKENQFVGSLS